MGSSIKRLPPLLLFVIACPIAAFGVDSEASWLHVEFSPDSPVLAVSSSLGGTTARPLGTSLAVDLHASLVLRNTSSKRISGMTLRVEAQDLTPRGKGSRTYPTLNVQPGEVFPVRIDMELVRPLYLGKTEGSLVRVALDCVLFSDLTAYGPDKLGSRRALMVYELEARRDRQYLADLLQTRRLAQLREELNFGLPDFNPQQLGLELFRDGRSNLQREQSVSVGAVSFPSSPVQPIGGAARVFGNEVRTPEVDVKNTSKKEVRSIEMGWIVQDDHGRDFVAGAVPTALQLAPVETARMTEPGAMRFSQRTGQPMVIGGLLAFVNDVEFVDGKLWIPSRLDIVQATTDPVLRRALSNSPEQQRLAEIYRRKGLNGLAEELRKGN